MALPTFNHNYYEISKESFFRKNDPCPTAVHSIVLMYALLFLMPDPISSSV